MSDELQVTHKADGASYWVMSDKVTFKVRSEAYALLELSTLPQMGPPPHSHEACDEVYFILEGTYEFAQPPNKPFHAGPGDTVRIPRGVLHTYHNTGHTPGRFLLWVSPGHAAGFFEELGVDAKQHPTPPPPHDYATLLEVAQRYGMVMAMP